MGTVWSDADLYGSKPRRFEDVRATNGKPSYLRRVGHPRLARKCLGMKFSYCALSNSVRWLQPPIAGCLRKPKLPEAARVCVNRLQISISAARDKAELLLVSSRSLCLDGYIGSYTAAEQRFEYCISIYPSAQWIVGMISGERQARNVGLVNSDWPFDRIGST